MEQNWEDPIPWINTQRPSGLCSWKERVFGLSPASSLSRFLLRRRSYERYGGWGETSSLIVAAAPPVVRPIVAIRCRTAILPGMAWVLKSNDRGGMFVSSTRFVAEHKQNPSAELPIHGVEKTD